MTWIYRKRGKAEKLLKLKITKYSFVTAQNSIILVVMIYSFAVDAETNTNRCVGYGSTYSKYYLQQFIFNPLLIVNSWRRSTTLFIIRVETLVLPLIESVFEYLIISIGEKLVRNDLIEKALIGSELIRTKLPFRNEKN